MIEVKAIVRNAMGIHCRPAAVIVQESRGFTCSIRVACADGACDPRSILGLISLGLTEGTPVTITANGDDEQSVAGRLVELFERHFDFPPTPPGISSLAAEAD